MREDSQVELFKFSQKNNQRVGSVPPTLVFQIKESEQITGCVVGHVTSAQRKEILFTCFSGAVKSLVDRKQARRLGTTTEDTTQLIDAQIKQEKSSKLTALQQEVQKLEQKLAQEEQKL